MDNERSNVKLSAHRNNTGREVVLAIFTIGENYMIFVCVWLMIWFGTKRIRLSSRATHTGHGKKTESVTAGLSDLTWLRRNGGTTGRINSVILICRRSEDVISRWNVNRMSINNDGLTRACAVSAAALRVIFTQY